ncbi:MAG TPA: hypothetical protein VGA55_07400 [Bacteroidota bacterium]
MKTERFFRFIFYTGAAWNFLVSVPLVFLVPFLPSTIQIDPPRYPLFIYFNLMTVFLFAWIHLIVARSPLESRSLVTVLLWSKFLTVLVFAASLLFLPMPAGLVEFFLPGMIIDFIFGLLFVWCLIVSGRVLVVAPQSSN